MTSGAAAGRVARMKIEINYDLCEANAICMGIAPEVFEVRDDDNLYILDENPSEELRDEDGGGRPPVSQAGDHHRGVNRCPDRRRVAGGDERRPGAARRGPRQARSLVIEQSQTSARRTVHRCPSRCSQGSGSWDGPTSPSRASWASWTSTSASASRPCPCTPRTARWCSPTAAGSAPRAWWWPRARLPDRCPARQPEGVHTLRTGHDAVALRDALEGPRTGLVVVVGAGFIGAEVAATCRGRGLEVTMVEAAAVPLQRALPGEIGALRRRPAPRERGGCAPRRGHRRDRRPATTARCARSDWPTAASSRRPWWWWASAPRRRSGWLEGSGLTLRAPAEGGGVLCDATMLAAPGVVAAGDVAAWPNPHFGGEVMRVEHWENAIDQGTHAGRRLLAELGGGRVRARSTRSPASRGSGPTSTTPRSRWSVGPRPEDEVVIVDGCPAKRRFVALFRRGDQCRAVLGVNRPRLVVQARMRLAESLDWDGCRVPVPLTGSRARSAAQPSRCRVHDAPAGRGCRLACRRPPRKRDRCSRS